MSGGRAAAAKPGFLLAGLVIAAVTTRPQLVGIGPLLGTIQQDLGVSHATVGILSTVPVLCMGIFAPLGPRFLRRLGVTRGVALCIGLIAAGGLGRALGGPFPLIVAFTFVIGIGMGAMGTAMPVVVARMASSGRTLATALYVTGINGGAAISSACAVPLTHATGSWRGAVGVMSAITVALGGAWLWAARSAGVSPSPDGPPARARLHRDPRLWLMVALFTALAICYYGVVSWLSEAYVERGWSETEAGALVAVLNLVALGGALSTPWIAKRVGERRTQLLAAAVVFLAGFVLLAAVPALAWVGAVLVGVANGSLFVLVMVLPIDLVERPSEVGAIASAMLTAGYTLAAGFPTLLGGVRDLAGGYSAVLWLLVGSSALFLVTSQALFRVARGRDGALEPAPARQ